MRLLVVVALVLAGCGTEAELERAHLDAHRYLGVAVHVGNLSVWPVHTDRPLDVGKYLTLKEAQSKQQVEVREKKDGAEVGTLIVENKGDLPILVCAGTVVKGGKQDRQIGQDFVIQAKSTVPVDAFCVEQGRWTMSRAGADTEGQFEVLENVAVVGARSSAQYDKDQGKVWQEVQVARLAHEEAHETESSLVDVVEAVRPTDESFQESVRAHFKKRPDAVGFAYAINGRPVTVRTFAHAGLLKGHFESFLKAMCTEALLARKDTGAGRQATADDVIALVRSINEAKQDLVATRAFNVNAYRKAAAGFNGTCLVGGGNGGTGGADKIALTEDWTARR